MTQDIQRRQPPGMPSGGQFAVIRHHEPGDGLEAEATQVEDVPGVGLRCEPVEPPDEFSFSSLNSFSFCPAQWAFEHVAGAEKDPATDTTARDVGVGAHRVAELMSSGANLDDAVSQTCSERPEIAANRDAVAEMAEKMVSWPPTDPTRDRILDTELKVSGVFGGVAVHGFADVLEVDEDGVSVVSDYKTGKAPSPVASPDPSTEGGISEPIFAPSTFRQAVMYAEMVGQTRGVHPGRVRMLYPAIRKVVELDLGSEYGRFCREEASRFVNTVSSRMDTACDSGRFDATPSPGRCSRCDFAGRCKSRVEKKPRKRK